MKNSILIILSAIMLTMLSLTAFSQEKKEPWPGVNVKVLTDNDHVKISEATLAPNAVADWHSHPQHTVYAISNVLIKVEDKGKEPTTVEVKAGQAMWFPAITHKITNIGKEPATFIITEIK
jgi:quercetin dioxygenase-like cupin family protein